jgi:beta-glucosidase-like glycosyl hydrolase
MTAHVAFPNIDPSGQPATLSPGLLKKLLRDEMGFKGAVCSDSLLMAGVRDRFVNEGEMALATLQAGVDLLLDLREPIEAVDYLMSCVESGTLDESRVDQAFERVSTLKQKIFAQQHAAIEHAARAGEQLFTDYSRSVATEAIEVLHDRGRAPLPFSPDISLGAILLKPFETAIDPPEQPLAAALCERFRNVKYMQIGPNADAAAYDSARELAASAKQLLVAMIVRPAAWHAFGLRPPQTEFLQQLAQHRGDVVLASLGVPYALDDFPDAAIRICTYSDVPVSQQALAEFLLGGQ